MEMPGIDMLHQELVVEVMKHLSPADRMTCATTAKRFSEALTHPELLKDVWFTVRGDQMGRAAPVLIESCRGYHNLRLTRANLYEFDLEFWGKVGKTLRRLALEECQWTPQVLYGILRECSRLTHLSIDCDRALPENLDPCGISIEDVRASLSNLQHLHVRTGSTDVLGHLLGLIPNVSAFSLQVSWQRFDWSTLINRTLADHRIVTELDLLGTSTSHAEFILIMGAFSGTLRELGLDCTLLTNGAAEAIADCSRLRRLSLLDFFELESPQMTKILQKNPGLETLELEYCPSLTDEGLSPILELRKLRRLDLHGCDGITTEFLRKLAEIPLLEYLHLAQASLDSRTLQSIARLRNLETLHVPDFVHSPETLEIICMNLGMLRTLSLGDCRNLSDADGLMLSRLRRLRTLWFRNAPGFKDLAIEGGIGGPELESLTVDESSLTDAGLMSLVGQHGRLKDITLSHCDNITDQGLMTLLPREPLLEKLCLGYCNSIGGEYVEALKDRCPRLWLVQVWPCATNNVRFSRTLFDR